MPKNGNNKKRGNSRRRQGGSVWEGTFNNTVLSSLPDSSTSQAKTTFSVVELLGNAPQDRAYQLRSVSIRALPTGGIAGNARPYAQALVGGTLWTGSEPLPLCPFTLMSVVNPTRLVSMTSSRMRSIAPTILNPVRSGSALDTEAYLRVTVPIGQSESTFIFEVKTTWQMGRQETLAAIPPDT